MSEPTDTTSPAPEAGTKPMPRSGDGIIDLRFLFLKLLRWWWLILLFGAIGAGKGVSNLHNFSPVFVAKMVVAPSQPNTRQIVVGGGLRSVGMGGMLPGLAVGPSGGATPFDRMVHAASTITLARRIDEKYGLMKVVFAGSWDVETQSWKRPAGREFDWRQKINKYLNFPLWSEPTLENLAAYLGGSFVVEPVANNQFQKISFKHRDSAQALKLLKMVYEEATKLVRDQDRAQLKKERRYLDGRMTRTSVIEFRDALMSVYVDQERREMMLKGDLPSVARLIEPAYVSKYKTNPNGLRLFVFPILLGFGLSFAFIVLVALIKHE